MRVKNRFTGVVLLLLISCLISPTDARAVLKDFGPLNFAGFPSWYRDSTDLPLQQCLSTAISPDVAGSLMCGVTMTANFLQDPPFDPLLPVTFPPNPPAGFNWPGEAFYFQAANDPAFEVAGSSKTLVEFGLESTFGLGDPSPGDQIVFARVRITLIGMPVSGTYTITHPYGIDVLNVDVNDVKSGKLTRDIGAAGVVFVGALQGNIGPFLRWTEDATYAGGLGTNLDGTITVGNETFVGDPNVPHTVTGSPFGFNMIRIEGPEGTDLDGSGNNFVESDLFAIEGQLWTTPIPTPLALNRATYARNQVASQVDIFASTGPLSNLGIESTLEVSGVSITPESLTTTSPTDGQFVGYFPDPLDLPVEVTVTNTADAIPQDSVTAAVVDEVRIDEANSVPSTNTLRIKAFSSDMGVQPTLTAVGLGALDSGFLGVPDVMVPPASVTVSSSSGGQMNAPIVVRDNYLIAAIAGENGTIDPSGDVAGPPGDNTAFSFIPSDGFRVVNVIVDGQSLGPMVLTLLAICRLTTASS